MIWPTTKRSRYTVFTAPADGWDDAVRRLPDHTVFHTLPWLESVRKVTGARLHLLRAEEDGACVGVWPFLDLRKAFLRVVGSPLPGWSTPYLGPLFAPEADVRAALRAFLEHPLLRRQAFFACRTLDRSRPVDLAEFGFSQVERFDTYLLSLAADEKTLWSNMDGECRNRVRKAQKRGVEVRLEGDDPRFLDGFWSMALETFARKGVTPTYSKELLAESWRALRPAGAIEGISAFHEGERVASLIPVMDGHTMYGVIGAARYTKLRDVPFNNLLHWEAIRLARSRGLLAYDFISTLGGPGRFKKTFGPTVVRMATHWERCANRPVLLLRTWYERYLRQKRRTLEARAE